MPWLVHSFVLDAVSRLLIVHIVFHAVQLKGSLTVVTKFNPIKVPPHKNCSPSVLYTATIHGQAPRCDSVPLIINPLGFPEIPQEICASILDENKHAVRKTKNLIRISQQFQNN
jgi:hypothetical protein